jgi:signal transduction histidine kinase
MSRNVGFLHPEQMLHSVLFDDRHADARFRRLIVVFARAAVAFTSLSAPLIAPTMQRVLLLWGVALLALAVGETIDRTGFIQTADHRSLFGILTLFSALIAVGCAVAGSFAAYGLMHLLPVLFSAIFFANWQRYAMPFVVTAFEFATAVPQGLLSGRVVGVRLLMFTLVGAFGACVSDVLRESVRTHRAMHSVLEAASGSADVNELSATGLAAALMVTGWPMGGVLLVNGDVLELAATSGLPEPVRACYAAEPIPISDGGMSAEIARTNEQRHVEDVPALYGGDHVLVQHGIQSMAGTPIPYHGQVIGVLITSQCTRRVPAAREIDRQRMVAEQLGLALGNARAHARESAVVGELRTLNERKDTFLSMVSHELRTPAAALELAASTLDHRADDLTPEDHREIRGVLLRRTRELRSLIETLLDSAIAERGDHLSLQPVQWSTAMHRWAYTLGDQTGRDIKVVVSGDTVSTLADPAKIERVVANLVVNAAKFSPPDTPIGLAVSVQAREIVLSVTDKGAGIAPDAQARIFERFFQVDAGDRRAAGGVGLGLFLVERVVALHGGSVHVASAPGRGSVFTVRLPRVPVAAAAEPEATTLAAAC